MVVHPVENASPIAVFSDFSVAVHEGAQQYLYDDLDGHYSPAGRGYPHGFHHHTETAVPPLHAQTGGRSPDDQDHAMSDLSVL